MQETFTQTEVASHNKPSDLWLIVNGDVYNLTEFQKKHPGGDKVLAKYAGKDATKPFKKNHNENLLKRDDYSCYCIGKLKQEEVVTLVQKESVFKKFFKSRIVINQEKEIEMTKGDNKIKIETREEILETTRQTE